METNSEDIYFRKLIAKSKLNVPFSDFDEKVMFKINKSLSKKTTLSKDLKLAWIFFILGSVFGIFVSVIIPTIQKPVFGIHLDRLSTLFQIGFTLLVTTQLNNLLSFYKKGFLKKI